MPLLRRCLGATEGLLDRILCVAGAVAFSQAPEFMQQYLQRLGGHLDEARRQLAQFETTARQAGLSLDAFIARTQANADTAVARLATLMRENVHRVADLQSAHDALLHATVFSRPFVFFRHVDPAIASGTWSAFRPAVPTTVEGLVYALLGILFFLTLYHGGARPAGRALGRRWRGRRARRLAAPAAPPPPPPAPPPVVRA